VPNPFENLIKAIHALTDRADFDRVYNAAVEREKELRAKRTSNGAAAPAEPAAADNAGAAPDAIQKLVSEIRAMTSRKELVRVQEAVIAREERLRHVHALEVAATLQVGDRVRIQGIRPEYLIGLEGTVERLPEHTKVAVKLDHPDRAEKYIEDDGTIRINADTLAVIPVEENPRTAGAAA
jgi:hypothetical protein